MKGLGLCPANSTSLRYDTACLNIDNGLNHSINLFTVSSECFQCDSLFWWTVPAKSNLSLVVSAVFSLTLTAAHSHDNLTLCHLTHGFQEQQVALWTLGDGGCSFTTLKQGTDIYQPLYLFLTFIIGLLLLAALIRDVCTRTCWRRFKSWVLRDPTFADMESDLGDPGSSSSSSSSSDSLPLVQSELVPVQRLNSNRVRSLDTFRGLTIAMMIFVNYGGGKYWFFEHAAWNGLTFADLVFPWFAWVMGVSMVLSVRGKLRSGEPRFFVFLKGIWRGLKLMLLGGLLNMYNNNDVVNARSWGVLQRLGYVYMVIIGQEIAWMKTHPRVQRILPEIQDSWRQWVMILTLAVVHVGLTLFLQVPGCPTGYLGPGGLGNHSFASNCTGGAARYIDSLLYGDNHLYQHSRVSKVYHTALPFDPEGFLGSLTACLTVYLGVQAGYIILNYNSTWQRCLRWLAWATFTGVSAGFLCGWSVEGGYIPINKQLWSLSFTLLTSSLAFLVFTLLYMLIDSVKWSACSGREVDEDPFRILGLNPLLVYVGHIITKNSFPWSWQPVDETSHTGFFLMNVFGTLLWIYIAGHLHTKQIYLTI